METILLIDDDEVLRENTAEILELAHYRVVRASDGKEGARLACQHKPDLIVCDIVMPELDGFGVLHILSKDPETSDIPFIFLSAKSDKCEIRYGMVAGADDYLTKPFEKTELLNAIESRLHRKQLIRWKFDRRKPETPQDRPAEEGLKPLEALLMQKPAIRYRPKEIVFHEGNLPQYLYFLAKGRLKTYKIHDDGKEFITHLHKAGDFFGYASLLDEGEYAESAMTLEDCEIHRMHKDEFIALLLSEGQIAAKFIKILSSRIAVSEKQLVSLAYDRVKRRVARALLLLDSQYGEGSGRSFKTGLNRHDIASIAGTAMETVVRSLSEFKSDHFIEIHGQEIIILDPEGLKGIQ